MIAAPLLLLLLCRGVGNIPGLFLSLMFILIWLGIALYMTLLNKRAKKTPAVFFLLCSRRGLMLIACAGIVAGLLCPLILIAVNMPVLGFTLVVVPFLFIVTLFIFAPLLILDKNAHWKDALYASKQYQLYLGADTIGVLMGFVVINLLAFLFLLFPLLVTLPITMSVVIDFYQKIFQQA